jgi:hypothetical protein
LASKSALSLCHNSPDFCLTEHKRTKKKFRKVGMRKLEKREKQKDLADFERAE